MTVQLSGTPGEVLKCPRNFVRQRRKLLRHPMIVSKTFFKISDLVLLRLENREWPHIDCMQVADNVVLTFLAPEKVLPSLDTQGGRYGVPERRRCAS